MKFLIKILFIFAIVANFGLIPEGQAYTTGACGFFSYQSLYSNTVVMENQKKVCSKCGCLKSLSEFNKDIKSKDNYRYNCKACDKIIYTDYRKTIKGVITSMYAHQKSHSKIRNHCNPIYSSQDLLEFARKSIVFYILYDKWVSSGYQKMLKPSFDRANDLKGYSFENFNGWVTWMVNKQRRYDDVRLGKCSSGRKSHKPVIGINLISQRKVYFISVNDAARLLNINQSHISSCCNKSPQIGRRMKDGSKSCYIKKSAGGYTWKFENKT